MSKYFIRVAVPTPLRRLFTYTYKETLSPGVRVKVPFGPRKIIGVVWDSSTTTDVDETALKAIHEVVDKEPVYDATLLKLAEWISHYYISPLGEVLRTMLPASSKGGKTKHFVLTPKGQEYILSNDEFAEVLRKSFKKRLKLTQVTFRKNLLSHAADMADLERWFLNKGLIKVESAKHVSARTSKGVLEELSNELKVLDNKELTGEQAHVFQYICEHSQGEPDFRPKPFLIRGVTGSGKTEIYLHLIHKILEEDAANQVLMMVPEISLTPQMTKIFTERFPEQIAVVHSGMSDGERWEFLESIRSGARRVLIGPRSSVFAPFRKLALLIVDEEHDQSYKQGTGLPYHGRDVAVIRAHFERAILILGSATPSMESYHNAQIGKYHLCELDRRALGNPLPQVELVESEPIKASSGIIYDGEELSDDEDVPISPEVVEKLRANLQQGNQSIVIVNRRGYAYYLFDLKNKTAVTCADCSISLTVHGRNQYLKCHYCDFKTSIKRFLESHPQGSFAVVGYGSQRAEQFLQKKLPEAKIVRLDSDTVTQRDALPEILNSFRKQEIDILVGTQILAKGHDFPKVTLMAIIEVDKQMSLPDFRSGERSFQLIVQAAGRAGRAEQVGQVVIQTSKTDHPTIALAMQQDFKAFAVSELDFRKKHNFPPFTRLALVEYSSQDMTKLMQFDKQIDDWFAVYERHSPVVQKGLAIVGPLNPPIQTIRGRHRRHIIFRDVDSVNLHAGLNHFLDAFQKLPHDIRMRVDIDPQSML